MSKTPFPRAAPPWADPLWWAKQQIKATTYVAHMTEAMIRASISAYGDVARSSVRALAHGATPWGSWGSWGSWGIATATPAAPVRAAPAPAAPVWEAPAPAAAPPVIERQLNGAGPKPALTPVPPAAELAAVPPARELTAVPPEPQPAAAPQGPAEAPVPGWDELTLGSIRARLRRLSEDDLVALRGWEEGHGARPDVLSMLAHRLDKVRSAAAGA